MNTKGHLLKKRLREWLCYLPLSDRQYTEVVYRHYFQRPLRLNPPVTFTEKIQWLKLFGSGEKLSSLVDKYAVREYVTSRVGAQYLNKLYGVYTHEFEIDFDSLPEKFVLKATHGSGWNIFCRDKRQFDSKAARRQLRKWLGMNYYRACREPNYKHVPPRIVCEHFLEDEKQKSLLDYKFFCFHGRVQIVQVDFDRFTNHTRNMYDRDWALCPFMFLYPNNPLKLKRPENFEKMIEVAEALADGIPFVRVDLYNVASEILFGELTFTPGSGLEPFSPVEWDYRVGAYLQLPDCRKPRES